MIAAAQDCADGKRARHVQAWTVSLLLHGTIALCGILLAKHTTFPPQPEAFRWNISLLSSSEPVQPTTAPPDQTQIEPFTQQTTPAPSEHTDRSVVTPRHVIGPPLPSAISQPTNTGEVYQVTDRDGSISFTNVPSDSHYRKIDIERRPLGTITQSAAAPMAPLAASRPQTAASSPSTEDSNSWLMETIVCGLKKHLEQAREYSFGGEGQVVLEFMIYEDGNLGNVNVFQSSGLAGLDQAAIKYVERSAPFSLPRPLGKPFVTVLFPIAFRGMSDGYTRVANPCPK